MISNFLPNFEFIPTHMDHDDTYTHEHHHTPAKLASHEYQKCMHNKKNEKECKEQSIKIYEDNISAEQKYIDCMNSTKTKADERMCELTFNSSNEYAYSNALKNYEVASLQLCLNEELDKKINKYTKDCNTNSENLANSIGQNALNKECMEKKQKFDKNIDKVKECIENLKNGETKECLENPEYNILYGQCYENKGLNLKELMVTILSYLTFPISRGLFFFIYFAFTIMSFVFFGGLFFSFIWMLVIFMYTIIGNNGSRAFPGIIIYELINQYFQKLHPYIILFSGLIWAFLFGICIMLYFFKKTFGWWPAEWVWKAIGIFPGNEKPVFNWFDRLFGCAKKSGRKGLHCHGNNLWLLMEDWLVEFSQKVLKIDKTELEIRNAINAFRDLGSDDIKLQYSISKMAEDAKKKAQENGEIHTDNKDEFTNFEFGEAFKEVRSTFENAKAKEEFNWNEHETAAADEQSQMNELKYNNCVSEAATEVDKKTCEDTYK